MPWIDTTDLKLWANRRESQGELPRVVRRLVRATVDTPHRVAFPGGDAVAIGGYDGIVEVADGNEFVPDGRSVWELGVNKAVKGKADDDYDKRTKNPGDMSPAETTFLFVTPRTWSKKDDWAEEKRKEGVWKDVRAYDASDLEEWLEVAPGVAVGIARLMGKYPEGFLSVNDHWADWAHSQEPVMDLGVIRAGRDNSADALLEWLAGDESVLQLEADSQEEAALFVTSLLSELDEAEEYAARALVIEEPSVWRRACSMGSGLILIPVFDDDVDVGAARRRGNRVIVPGGPESFVRRSPLKLPRPAWSELQAALQAVGVAEAKASRVARAVRGSVSGAIRLLAAPGRMERPAWSKGPVAKGLASALLCGGWVSSSELDVAVVSGVGALEVHDLGRLVVEASQGEDAGLRSVGEHVAWISRERAWELLRGQITAGELDRLKAKAVPLLRELDPALELDADERWMAAIKGAVPRHSAALRTGVAEGLALVAARPADSWTFRGEDYVAVIVREVLDSDDWKLWASLDRIIPVLAEAAPSAFMDAVERLVGSDSLIASLGERSQNYLTGILWALECLAWDRRYLTRAAGLLAGLAAPLANDSPHHGPAASLRAIFCGWNPQTTANVQERLAALDYLESRADGVGWRLALRLLPVLGGDSNSPTYKPRWRDWLEDHSDVVPMADFRTLAFGAASRLLAWVGTDGGRWADLIRALPRLPAEHRKQAVVRLEQVEAWKLNADSAEEMWAALRSLLHRHRRYPDAEWSMGEDELEPLDRIYRKLAPKDLVRRYRWLFGQRPEFPDAGPKDWEEEQQAMSAASTAAVEELAAQDGELGRLVSAAVEPFVLGRAVGRSTLTNEELGALLEPYAGSESRQERLFVLGVVEARSRDAGPDWVVEMAKQWPAAESANLLCGLPFSGQTWDALEGLDPAVAGFYWTQVSARFVRDKEADGARAIRSLLDASRPFAALELSGSILHRAKKEALALALDLIAEILEASSASDPGAEAPALFGSAQYAVQQLFVALDQGGFDRAKTAVLEWKWLPALRHGERGPDALAEELMRDPGLFVQMLSFIFRSEDDEGEEEATEHQRNLASHAWQLLRGLTGTPFSDGQNVDEAALLEWVATAREGLRECGRATIGDEQLGELLARAPRGEDGHWPHEAVRAVLEQHGTEELRRGMRIGIGNSRGVLSKSIGEGGDQERRVAERYRSDAAALAASWPAASAVLGAIADGYESDAKREDLRGERDLDWL